MLLLLTSALAGDLVLYRRALDLVERHYLRPEQIELEEMLAAAGERLESDLEWLLVDTQGPTVVMRDGLGAWTTTVVMEEPGGLALAMAAIEDAVVGAGLPMGKVDARVSLLRGALSTLDRHSTVLHAEGLERFDERLNGTLSGIGATIGVRSHRLVVKALFDDGPAARGGLQVGDHVLKIGAVSTVGMDASDATRLIRGEAGTSVSLTVERAGTPPLEIHFERQELTIPNVKVSLAPGDIGVLTIDHFSEQTRGYLQLGLDELADKGVLNAGLILDVRENSGGSLIESGRAVDTFVETGVIVTTAGRENKPVTGLLPRVDARPGSYDLPLVVLMDHDTASGAEILAGALAELDRALLIGQGSFGKGTVQKVYPVGPDIKIKLTVAEYLVAGTGRVADVGLAPDVALSPVRFNRLGVWYPEPEREARQFSKETLHFWWADEDDGWREGEPPVERDVVLEVAAAVVGGAQGTGRDALLSSATRQQARIRAAEDQRLIDTFAAGGIDWRAPAEPTTVVPEVEVRLEPETHPEAGATVLLNATVVNNGPALYRTAVRLRSDNPAWDDVVLPIGFLASGATARGQSRVEIGIGSPTRTDTLELRLESATSSPASVGRQTLHTIGHALPSVAVNAALLPDSRVSLTVENRSDRTLPSLRARFSFPDTPNVVLTDFGTEPVTLGPRRTSAGSIGLTLSGDAATVPLEVLVEADEMPHLARWDFELARDGTSLRLEAPVIAVGHTSTVNGSSTRLNIKVSDDRRIDHVVVYAGTERVDRSRYEASSKYDADKVAWQPGAGRKVFFSLPVPVEAGTNRYVVVAEDDQGLRVSQDVYVLGTSTDAGG